MKKLSEFDSLEDFGYESRLTETGQIEFIKCDNNFGTSITTGDPNFVYTNGDLSIGKFFTLNDILSGGTINVDLSDSVNNDQAELAIDYSLATSLAYLGSVYSVVMIGINKIKETYPNGFEIVSPVSGANTIMFNTNDINLFGSDNFILSNYENYEYVQANNGLYDKTFEINTGTSITGGSFTVLFLNGTPNTGPTYTHFIQPKESTLDKFYATVTPYELDLLVPPVTRTNYYPRQAASNNNILFDGVEYDLFVKAEQDWATLADNNDSNFIWRKLYPDGQKNLDSDDNLIQKMILTIAANFDNIKKYQDQLKYQQTIGYTQSEHVSKDLVELLSNQWNFGIGHNLNQDDYSEYIYSQYENYITGSSQKLSAKDVNFEMWRRVLSNITTLYKKKGTKEAIKYIANMYGLPEALLWIEELINSWNNGEAELITSESNITVKIDDQDYYIDEMGSATTLSYRHISNTKYLNVNISPFDAIEFDFYDWGWEHHPDVGSIIISSTTQPTKNEFFKRVYNATIGSNANIRYDKNYQTLENEGQIYYSNSVNQITLSSLDPYMDFLDDNWNVLITDLIPASSRLLSVGTLYKNPMWHREKHQWEDERIYRDLPLNETIDIPNFTPTISLEPQIDINFEIPDPIINLNTAKIISIDNFDISSNKQISKTSSLENIIESAKMNNKMYGAIMPVNQTIFLIDQPIDIQTMEYSYSGNSYNINSPTLVPISPMSGTNELEQYSSDALIVTNDNKFNIEFSATNLSDGGYTQLQFELFTRKYDNNVVIDEDQKYSILKIEFENSKYGVYKVSNVKNIDTLDYISIDSDYIPHLNNEVQITYIDSGSSIIRTSPPIGLISIPTGQGNTIIDWYKFINSGAIGNLKTIKRLTNLTDAQLISILNKILKYVDDKNLSNVPDIAISLSEFNISENDKHLFTWFMEQNTNIIYGSLLIIEFTKGNPSWSINSPEYQLVNMVILYQTKATFKRIVNFFDWKSPDQIETISNFGSNSGDWVLPTLDTSNRTELNDFSTSGTVTFGGLNYLNSNILIDKTEYFYRVKAFTHTPKTWETVSGLIPFALSGGSLIESGYDIAYLNGIKYYGKYFVYMNTPKVPVANIEGLNAQQTTPNSSIISKWHGVGDSDRLELQYIVTGGTPVDGGYTEITESDWETGSTSINIKSRDGVGDEYIYTIQTTLEPDTYYWWRIKNFRSKLNMFGNNLEYFTTTEPGWFKTGGFSDSGSHEGEIEEMPTLPDNTFGKMEYND